MGFELEKRIAAEARQRLLDEERRRAERNREAPARTGKLSGIMGHALGVGPDAQESHPVANIPWPTSQRSRFDDYRVAGLCDVMLELAISRDRHDLLPATIAAADPSLVTRPDISVPNLAAGQTMWRVAERRAATLYRHAVDAGEVTADDPVVDEALERCGGGHALPTDIKRKMEDEFGVSLGRVRIHTDSVAADAARAVCAEAFTVGEDIFFAESAFAPDTRAGQKLIAHELAHVVQAWQGRAGQTGSAGGASIRVSQASESLEQEAEAVAERIDRRIDRQTDLQIDRGIDRQIDRGIDRQIDRGIDRQTELHPTTIEHANPQRAQHGLTRYTASLAPAVAARKQLAELGGPSMTSRGFSTLLRRAAAGAQDDKPPHKAGQPQIQVSRDHATEHAHHTAARASAHATGAVHDLNRRVDQATKSSLDHVDRGVNTLKAHPVGKKAEQHGRDQHAVHEHHRRQAHEQTKHHHAAAAHHQAHHHHAHHDHHAANDKVDAHSPIKLKPVTDWNKYMPAPLPDQDERERKRILKLVQKQVGDDRRESKHALEALRKRQIKEAGAVRAIGPGLIGRIGAAQSSAIGSVSAAEAAQAGAVMSAVAMVQGQVKAHAAAMKAEVNNAYMTSVQLINSAMKAATAALVAGEGAANAAIDGAMSAQLAAVAMMFSSTKLQIIALGNQKAGEASALGSSISLPYSGDKLDAAKKAAKEVAAEYAKAMPSEAGKAASQIGAKQASVESDTRKMAVDQKNAVKDTFEKAKTAVKTAHEAALKGAQAVKTGAESQIGQIAATTVAQLGALGASQVAAIRGQAASARAGITSSGDAAKSSTTAAVAKAAAGIEKGALGVIEGAKDIEAPDPHETKKSVRESASSLSRGTKQIVGSLESSTTSTCGGLAKQASTAAGGMAATATAAAASAQQMGAGANQSLTATAKGASDSLKQITVGFKKHAEQVAKAGVEGFKHIVDALKNAYQTAGAGLQKALDDNVKQVSDSFNKAVPAAETADILKNAKKAADAVKPWWQQALAFVVSVVVAIVVVVVVTALIVTTGPVGAILVGAAAGALSSVAGQMASNLVLGNGLTEGITWQSVAIGAIAGGAAAGLSEGIGAIASKAAGSSGTIGAIGKTVVTGLEGGGGLGGYGIRVGENVLTDRGSDAAAQLIVNGKYEFSVKDLVISLGGAAITSTHKFSTIQESAGGRVREALNLPPIEAHGHGGAGVSDPAGGHGSSSTSGHPAGGESTHGGSSSTAAHGGGETTSTHGGTGGGSSNTPAHGGGETTSTHGKDSSSSSPASSAHGNDHAPTSPTQPKPGADPQSGAAHGNDPAHGKANGDPNGGAAHGNDPNAGHGSDPNAGGAHAKDGATDPHGGAVHGNDPAHAKDNAPHDPAHGNDPAHGKDGHAPHDPAHGKDSGAPHGNDPAHGKDSGGPHDPAHPATGNDPAHGKDSTAGHGAKPTDQGPTAPGGAHDHQAGQDVHGDGGAHGDAAHEAEAAAHDTALNELGYPQGTRAKKEELAAKVEGGSTPTKDELRDTAANERGAKELDKLKTDPNLDPEAKAKLQQDLANKLRAESDPTGNLSRDLSDLKGTPKDGAPATPGKDGAGKPHDKEATAAAAATKAADEAKAFKDLLGPKHDSLMADAQALKADPALRDMLAGHTDQEVAAMIGYTTEDYRMINTALRSGDPAELARLQSYIGHASRGLDRLPDYQGPVYRGAHLSPDKIERYKVGDTVTEPAFTSTSYEAGAKFDGNVEFIIQSKTGKKIDFLSKYKSEKEVLFGPDKKFKVLDRHETGGKVIITMTEVQ